MFKVNNRNTRKRCEICSKFLFLTLNISTPFFIVSFTGFEQANVSWDSSIEVAADLNRFTFNWQILQNSQEKPVINSAFSKVANLKPINFAKKVFFTGAFLWVFRFFKIDIPHVVTPSVLPIISINYTNLVRIPLLHI